MIFRGFLIIGSCLLFTANVPGQVLEESEIKSNNIISNILEDIAEDLDEEPEFEELFEQMEQLQEYPININSTNEGELKQIVFLDDYRISSMMDYIHSYGDLLNLYELNAIEGFDKDLIEAIMPYIKITPVIDKQNIKFKDIFCFGKNQVLIKYNSVLEAQQGYSLDKDSIIALNSNQYYLGSPGGVYLRYSFNYKNKIKAGFTFDKDPGEELFMGSQRSGFDYYSAHLYMQNIGRIKSLAIGDYKLLFGQGVALWSGLGFGKSSEGVQLKRYGRGILAYTSTNESSLFRGIASTLSVNRKFDISLFYSRKKRDANIIEADTINSEITFTSFSENGYHRTINEIDDRNSIKEILYGGNISFRSKKLRTGLTFYRMNLDASQNPLSKPYNLFRFSGKELQIVSISYNYLHKQFSFFGELSYSFGGFASLNGINAGISPRLSLSFIHRYYSSDYHCIHCNAFSESGHLSNEFGTYIGFFALLHPKWRLSGYTDNFSFPWFKYGIDGPTRGNEYLLQLQYNVSRTAFMYFRYRNKNKQHNYSDHILDHLVRINKNYFRYQVEYSVSNTITFKNRIEYVYLKSEMGSPQKSILIYQDIIFSPVKPSLRLVFRYALFDTESYDTRIYAYENDVLYSYSVPAYYDEGYRYYFLLKSKLFKNLDFWIRFARTKYTNKESVGSGPSLIDGNTRSEVKVMVRYKF